MTMLLIVAVISLFINSVLLVENDNLRRNKKVNEKAILAIRELISVKDELVNVQTKQIGLLKDIVAWYKSQK